MLISTRYQLLVKTKMLKIKAPKHSVQCKNTVLVAWSTFFIFFFICLNGCCHILPTCRLVHGVVTVFGPSKQLTVMEIMSEI